MNDDEFDILELTKIISIFNKNDIKLTFENFTSLKKTFYEILPICIERVEKLYQYRGHFSKMYNLSCKLQKIINIKKYYQYSDLKLLNQDVHYENIKSLDKLMVTTKSRNIPILDLNGVFGVNLTTDEKYVNTYQYIVVPFDISKLDLTAKIQSFSYHKLNENWYDYICFYPNTNKCLSVMSFDFNVNKIVDSVRYSVYIKDFIEQKLSSYVKMDNLMNFLSNEYHLHNLFGDECYLHLPSSSSKQYDDDFISVEIMPSNKEMESQGKYFKFLEDYFSKMIEYDLMTTEEKQFILNHETTKNKSNLIKFVWSSKNDYEVQWCNIEYNNMMGG
jgi:hypothetical protein